MPARIVTRFALSLVSLVGVAMLLAAPAYAHGGDRDGSSTGRDGTSYRWHDGERDGGVRDARFGDGECDHDHGADPATDAASQAAKAQAEGAAQNDQAADQNDEAADEASEAPADTPPAPVAAALTSAKLPATPIAYVSSARATRLDASPITANRPADSWPGTLARFGLVLGLLAAVAGLIGVSVSVARGASAR